MDIDIYDFDKTIVPFDSGSLFVAYCMVHFARTSHTSCNRAFDASRRNQFYSV